MSIRFLATIAALTVTTLAAPAPAKTTGPSATTTTLIATATNKAFGLDDAAKAAGKLWFGTAVDIPGTGEAQDKSLKHYQDTTSRMCEAYFEQEG